MKILKFVREETYTEFARRDGPGGLRRGLHGFLALDGGVGGMVY